MERYACGGLILCDDSYGCNGFGPLDLDFCNGIYHVVGNQTVNIQGCF